MHNRKDLFSNNLKLLKYGKHQVFRSLKPGSKYKKTIRKTAECKSGEWGKPGK
jgi:hypothetical protein